MKTQPGAQTEISTISPGQYSESSRERECAITACVVEVVDSGIVVEETFESLTGRVDVVEDRLSWLVDDVEVWFEESCVVDDVAFSTGFWVGEDDVGCSVDVVVEVSFGSANDVVAFTAIVAEGVGCVDVDVSTGASSVDSRVVEEGVEETVVDDEVADGSDEVVVVGVGISSVRVVVAGAVDVDAFAVCVVDEVDGCVDDVVETGFVVVDGMLRVVVDGTDETKPSGGNVE